MNARLLTLLLSSFGFGASGASGAAAEPLVVVATHSALGDIVRQVGGARVDVTSIALATQDLHAIRARPSDFATLGRADAFVHSGLDLELWAIPAIRSASNPKIRQGAKGNVDVSLGIKMLRVPAMPTRADGDVHIYGNPHYWMDPLNGIAIAKTIAAALTAIDAEGARDFLKGAQEFERDVKTRLVGWLKRAIARKNMPIVVYHDSFPYFVRRFGLRQVATLEVRPRILPTQRHLLTVLATIEEHGVEVCAREPFHDQSATDFVEERAGVRVVTLGTMPGFKPGVETYQDMIEANLTALFGPGDA